MVLAFTLLLAIFFIGFAVTCIHIRKERDAKEAEEERKEEAMDAPI